MIPAVGGPLSSAIYVETGSSRRTCPRSTSSISEVVVAMTLVSEARSYMVLSGSTAGLDVDHVRCP